MEKEKGRGSVQFGGCGVLVIHFSGVYAPLVMRLSLPIRCFRGRVARFVDSLFFATPKSKRVLMYARPTGRTRDLLVGAVELQGVALWLVRGAALVKLSVAVPGHPDLHPTIWARAMEAVLYCALAPDQVPHVVVAEGLLNSRALLELSVCFGLGRCLWREGGSQRCLVRLGGGPAGQTLGWGERLGRVCRGWEAVILPSTLACWGLGADVPLFLRARFGGTGGGGTGGAWTWKKGCVTCWPGPGSRGSGGVCMVAFARFLLRSASFHTVSGGSVGHGNPGWAVIQGVLEGVVLYGLCLHDPGLRGFWCVCTAGGPLGPVQHRLEGLSRGSLSAGGSGGLEESLPASWGIPGYISGV